MDASEPKLRRFRVSKGRAASGVVPSALSVPRRFTKPMKGARVVPANKVAPHFARFAAIGKRKAASGS